MNRRSVRIALTLVLLAPAGAVGQGGIVEGTVFVPMEAPSDPPTLNPYARGRYAPPARGGGGVGSPENVVVYLRSGAPEIASSGTSVNILQRDQTIIPRVTAVQMGTTVAFPNDDDTFHNLFSLSQPKTFNLGRYPPGESRSEVFDRPGLIRLFCDIHSQMVGIILVLETPHFTRPDASGSYQITGVPPGTYTVVAWRDGGPEDAQEVTVRAEEPVRVDFRFGG